VLKGDRVAGVSYAFYLLLVIIVICSRLLNVVNALSIVSDENKIPVSSTGEAQSLAPVVP